MMRKVEDIIPYAGMQISDLMEALERSGGFTSKFLSESVSILEDMVRDPKSVNFLSFPADIISTGARGIIVDAIKRKFFDVIITTGGTIDHDIARCYADYYHGSFDVSDEELYEKEIHRLGNIFIPFKKTEKLSDINRIIESAEKMGWGCVMDLETEFIVCRPLVTEKEVVV